MSKERSFAGTWILLRFMLRRDRIQLPIWITGIIALIVTTLTAYEQLYPTAASRQETAAIMKSPASLAMTGPKLYLDNYTYGAMIGHQMLSFASVVVALMSVLLVVRHTRREEETGRMELVRASVIGRHANTTATLLLAAGANIAVGLLLAVTLGSLGIESVTWSGSFLYGAALASVGLSFTGAAIVISQLLAHARGAIGAGSGLIAVAYALRAMGDVGDGWWSWLSPIGWALQTAVYVDNLWWPLLVSLAFAMLLAAIAYPLSTKRDVGAGMVPPRRGKATATRALIHPFGLAFRLQRANVMIWSLALFLFGAMYGTFLGEAEQLLASIGETMAGMLPAADVLADSMAAMFMSVLAIISTIPALQSLLRIRAEEREGRIEGLLSGAISRYRLLGGYLALALLNSLILLFAAGLGMGAAGSQSMGDARYLPDLIASGLMFAPAFWVVFGFAAALIGLFPRAAAFSWAVPVFAIVVIYLGGALQLPEWLMNISPYQHISRYPAEPVDWAPLLWLTGLAAVFAAIGLAGYRRRDLSA